MIMITSLEIIERSIYHSILRSAIKMGNSVDPEQYYPLTEQSINQFKVDAESLSKYVAIFGAGNSQSKGTKVTPRIVVDSHGFFPGSIGFPKQDVINKDGGYVTVEYPFETLDQFIDIRLVSGNQNDNRVLHNILFHSIPRKGYIPQWPNTTHQKTGNVFLELVNFFDKPDISYGLIEKVYQFAILDCLVTYQELEDLTPLNEITLLIEKLNSTLIFK